jgi:hypothetical protein
MDKIDRSLFLGLCWTATYFFIHFRTEKQRYPSVFATGSVRYSRVPASRGALVHGPDYDGKEIIPRHISTGFCI